MARRLEDFLSAVPFPSPFLFRPRFGKEEGIGPSF